MSIFSNSEIKYLQSLSSSYSKKFIPNDELKIIIQKYREDKDPVKLNLIIQQGIRYVMYIAKQFKRPEVDLGDLVHAGIEGVIDAANQYYDLNMNEKFITYIQPLVRQRMKDCIDECVHTVVLPKNISSDQRKLKLGETASSSIIYSKINLSSQADLMRIYHSNGISEAEFIESRLDLESKKIDINRVFSGILTKHEADVLQHYFGLNDRTAISLESISELYGVTRQRISTIKNTAVSKIRANKKATEILFKYLIED